MSAGDMQRATELGYEACSLASMIAIIADYGMSEGGVAGQMGDALLGASTLAKRLSLGLLDLTDPVERKRRERAA